MPFIKQYSSYFTDNNLEKLQNCCTSYVQLQRTHDQVNIQDLYRDLNQENQRWIKYLLTFAAFVITNFPAPWALAVFFLLIPGQDFGNFCDPLNHASYKVTKNGKTYHVSFFRYWAPAGYYRYLHAACFYSFWDCLDHFGFQSDLQAQCALVSYYLLSLCLNIFIVNLIELLITQSS